MRFWADLRIPNVTTMDRFGPHKISCNIICYSFFVLWWHSVESVLCFNSQLKNKDQKW